ncbi:MAG TPA: DNA gyrase inhibitor YacG [Blastocatellia bacterium]|nr:DNA gyrase inhibitor YacG [Blastocatellia bacterium]
MKCPICAKTTTWNDNPDRPFCSERCRLIDLGRWSGEDYRVSVPLKDVSDGSEPPTSE